MSDKVNNFLTFDIEEWYHANYDSVVIDDHHPKETNLSSLVSRLIDICDEYNIKATFFVLGCVAKDKNDIVKKLFNSGHEIASHGFSHRLVYSMTPNEFKRDVQVSCDILEEITGKKVSGFRAPSWSVKKEQLSWYYDILGELGLSYSSSVYPGYTYLYGINDFPPYPHYPIVDNGKSSIIEIPQSVVEIFRRKIGFSGGFYLRLLPIYLVKRVMKKRSNVFVYLHPREIDKNQEKLKLGIFENFIHYYGINSCEKKLISIIDSFSKTFTRMDEFAATFDIV